MASTDILKFKHWPNSPVVLMERIQLIDGTDVQQADITTITRYVHNLTTEEDDDTGVELVIADVLFDDLQTDSKWTEDNDGYNFADTVLASLLVAENTCYQVVYVFDPVNGEDYRWVAAEINTLQLGVD